MAQIDKAFEVGDGIALDDEVLIYYTFSDPTSGAGYEAPKGSFLIQKPASGYAKLWEKYGDGNTEWLNVSRGAGGVDKRIIPSGFVKTIDADHTLTIDEVCIEDGGELVMEDESSMVLV